MNKMEVLKALQSNRTVRTGIRLDAKKVYTVHADGDVGVRLAPQAIKLLEIMFTQDVESWNEVELHDLLMEHTEISEKQTPWIVFKFYRQVLIDAGFLTVK